MPRGVFQLTSTTFKYFSPIIGGRADRPEWFGRAATADRPSQLADVGWPLSATIDARVIAAHMHAACMLNSWSRDLQCTLNPSTVVYGAAFVLDIWQQLLLSLYSKVMQCPVRSATHWCNKWSMKLMWLRGCPPRSEGNKMEIMWFSAPPGSVCKRQFLVVTIDDLDVKSLVEHNGEG